jgi:anti-anti-sigma regulatory factor
MQQKVRHWLDALPLNDPLERQQASLLQIILLIIVGGCVIGMLISFLSTAMSIRLAVSISVYTLLIVSVIGALVVLRSGHFTPAVALAIGGVVIPIGISLFTSGFTNPAGTFMAFTLPVTMAGLLLSRRGLLIVSAAEVGIVVIVGLVQASTTGLIGFIPVPPPSAATLIPIFTLLITVLSLFLDRFGASLRDALTTTQAREQELQKLRAEQETIIAERTAALQTTVEQLRANQATLNELGAPILPILPGVLAAPLIGAMDSARAGILADKVLAAVERHHTQFVIFDITGVPLVDTQVAKVLLQTAAAVQLLGARTAIVGISPEIAQTMVALNVDLGRIEVYSNLQQAISALLARHEDQPVNSLP